MFATDTPLDLRAEQESTLCYDGAFASDYGRFATLSDLFRRIALDEREHKEQSIARMDAPRFGISETLE